jgi:hypothetical protein
MFERYIREREINLFDLDSKYTTKKNQYFFRPILEHKHISIFFQRLTRVFNSQETSASHLVYDKEKYDVIVKRDFEIQNNINKIIIRPL